MDKLRPDGITAALSLYTSAAMSDPKREALLAKLGVGPPIYDPDIDAILVELGLGEPIPDGDPLPPLEDVPQAEDDALKARLKETAPKAFFFEGDGLWLQYPSANRMVRAGDPREGDPQIHFEGVALHQGAHHSSRRRLSKKGVPRGD